MNEFHVGQKVKIVGNTHEIHYAIIPQIGEIVRAGYRDCRVKCKTINSGNNTTTQTIYTCDLRPIGAEII